MEKSNIGVGAIVKVVDSIHCNIPTEVRKYLGTFVEVSQVLKIAGYRILNDGERWIWDESLFERLSTHDEYVVYHSNIIGGDRLERE